MSSNIESGNLFRVDGLVAAITGGGTGIGLVMAKALMANGAKKVYILGRRQDVLDAAAKETAGLVPIQTDITSKDSLQAAVDKIAADEGYLNLLVANSGIVGTTRIWGTGNSVRSIKEMRQELFADNDFEDFTNAFRVNVAGSFFTLAAFLELLDEGNKRAAAGEGAFGGQAAPGVPFVQSQVIVTSSISAYVRGPTTPPSYGGSKAAILEMAKQASTQLAPHGIRVNIIAPGLFPSEMAAGLIGNRKPAEETIKDQSFIPAKKFGTDEEMSGTILYLASRAGAFCNGVALVFDGGRLSVLPSTY